MTKDEKITKHQFYFETPLYEIVEREKADPYLFSGEVDAYSAVNSFDTTYKVSSKNLDRSYSDVGDGGFGRVTLTCKRKGNDKIEFFVLVNEKYCTKIGQWPSLADIQFGEMGKKYDKHMSRGDLQEFKRAIGLAAHGVGVGAFVYLRRIFENLIDETYRANKATLGIREADFHGHRMEESTDTIFLLTLSARKNEGCVRYSQQGHT